MWATTAARAALQNGTPKKINNRLRLKRQEPPFLIEVMKLQCGQ
jgi:hypothetical protein